MKRVGQQLVSCPLSRTSLPSGLDYDNVASGACGSIVGAHLWTYLVPPLPTELGRRLHLAIPQLAPGDLSAHVERLSDRVLHAKR